MTKRRHPFQGALGERRVLDDVGPVERGTEDGHVGDLAAVAAADATVVDMGHRVVAQGVRRGFDGERRAPGKPDARAVAGAHVLVDPEARTHDALAGLLAGFVFRAHAGAAG